MPASGSARRAEDSGRWRTDYGGWLWRFVELFQYNIDKHLPGCINDEHDGGFFCDADSIGDTVGCNRVGDFL